MSKISVINVLFSKPHVEDIDCSNKQKNVNSAA